MQSSQFLSIFIIILAMIFSCGSSYKYNPRPCRETSCEGHCYKCEYGSVTSPNCGFEVCGKGPDHRCSEYQDLCGEGLTCQCGHCHGCSTRNSAHNCSTVPPCLPNYDYNFIVKRILSQLE